MTVVHTSKLLRLTTSVIRNKQCSVIGDKGVLQLILAVLIDEFLVVRNDGFRDRLADGVDLGCVSTTSYSDADVDVGELVEADDEERLIDLES